MGSHSPIYIIEDSREPPRAVHPWRWPEDRVVVIRRKLDAGDYSAALTATGDPLPIAVERKTLPDFIACCTRERDRFVRCLARMAELQSAVIIVEGTTTQVREHDYRSRTTPQAVLASARAFALDFRVPVWWAGNAQGGAWLCEWTLTRAVRKAQAAETKEKAA